MANYDGSIVLSVTIDTDEIKQGTTKIIKELEKQFASEQKVLREAEKTAQAKTKTATEQSKLNKSVYDELSAEQKAEASQSRKIKLKADENAAIYKELELSEKAEEAQNRKNAAQAKNNAEIYKELEAENRAVASQELGAQAEAKTVQEKQKALKATFDREAAEIRSAKAATDAQISEEKLASVKAKSASDEILAEEKIRENKTKNVILEEKAAQAQEKTKQEIIKTEIEQRKLITATNSVATALRKMAYSLGIMLSFREVFRFFDNASELASQTEANLKRLGALYGETAESVYDFANANAEAFGMSKTAAYDAAADYGNIFTTFASGAESAELTNQMLQATAVIASQTGRTYEDIFEKIRSGLYGNTRAIDDLGLSVRQSSLMQTKAYAEISENGTKSWNELTDSELQNARALGIIEQAADKYGDEILQSTALIRSQFNAAWEDFKTSWGTVVNGVLMPMLEILTDIINVLSIGATWIAKFMGKELKAPMASISRDSESFSDNIEDAGDSLKSYNKELKKTLAGFDDLQRLEFGGGADSGTGSNSIMQTITAENTIGGKSETNEAVSSWKSALAGIVEMLVGAGLVALGVLLLTNGRPEIGIGCIIAGLFTMGVGSVTLGEAFDNSKSKEILATITAVSGIALITLGIILLTAGAIPWGIGALVAGIGLLGYTAYEVATGFDYDEAMKTISDVSGLTGGALVAIGILLLWFGIYGWAIAAIVAGLALLGYSAYSLIKSGDVSDVESWAALIMEIAAGAMAGIGIILCMVGSYGWGIALIIAGIAFFAVAMINKSDETTEELKKWVNIVMAIASGVALAIGIILLCCGIITPLSIGLVVAGAIGLVAEIALNWNAIVDKVKEIFNKIKNFITTYGLLVLGILMCVSGLGVPVGIYLIVKWCKDNYGKIELATVIVDKVKEIWNKIKEFWDGHIAKVFTKDFWVNLLKKAGNGIISTVEKVLNFLTGGIRKLVNAASEVVASVGEVIGINLTIPKIPEIHLPRLAKGAVIPANREFLAVLGDQKSGYNVEAPAKLIKQMAMEAIAESGMVSSPTVTKEEHYYLDKSELMSIIYKLVKDGERVSGTSLA